MKKGDLVELSSYAKKLKRNSSLINKVGIIAEVMNPSSIHEIYDIYWIGGELQPVYDRKELKHFRRKG